MPPDGKGYSGIVVMGMAPASAEIKNGTPFHLEGKAGLIYRKILAKGGIDPDSLLTLNVLQCRPPLDNCNTEEARAAAHFCAVIRDAAIRRIKPKCIVALGNLPFEILCGETGVESKRGYEYWSDDYGCPVIPTLHPSFIEYTKATNLIPAVLYDMKIAPQRCPRGPTRMEAIEDPPLPEFRELCKKAKAAPWVVVDIETPWSSDKNEEDLEDDPSSQIVRVSFAFDTTTAVSFPFAPLYVDIFSDVMAGENDKLFWNANFDVPRLEHNGLPVQGRIVDVMWLWHFLQPDLPRGLGHVATYYTDLPEWKSKAIELPTWYSCCDAYATANVFKGVEQHLRDRGMWEIADRHVTDLIQVLRRMEKRGMCVDRQALEEFKAYLGASLAEFQLSLNARVPMEIRRTQPKNGYIRTPKDTHGLTMVEVLADVKENCPLCDNKKAKGKSSCLNCGGKGKHLRKGVLVQRYALLKDFSANSPDQVKDYMRVVGHRVPYSKKMERDTTEKRFLLRYASQYPSAIYALILDYRKYQKLKGTYSAWAIGSDDRVRTRFTLTPATGRLSSQNPNVQNIPAEGDLADKFRACLVASPGNVLLRRDYSGIEAVLTGYFANDPDYMRLAGMGIHAYALSMHRGQRISLDDPEIAAKLLAIKQDPSLHAQYKKIKTCIHGINYGLGPDQMFEANPGMFASKGEARKLKKFIFNLFPKIEKYQESVVHEARTTALIVNPFAYVRWLWDVPGQDGPKAIAQRPQSTAAAIIKEAMIRLDATPVGAYMIWQIHDELVLDVPEQMIEIVDAVLREVMESPIPQLGGLVIGTERKIGRSMK